MRLLLYFFVIGGGMAVHVFLAEGFEEIEALTVVDILRRADVDTQMVSLYGGNTVTGSHGIAVKADLTFDAAQSENADMLVLPGGKKGTDGLMAHEGLRDLLFEFRNAGKKITAICAAPSVLGLNGLLRGKKAVCYPGFEDKLLGAVISEGDVAVDGQFITGRAMGAAIPFALALVEALTDKPTAVSVADGICYKWE
jgi:4-methyl-5(b-hydroxyethyl)-thiazole monophosphate biosynthesis